MRKLGMIAGRSAVTILDGRDIDARRSPPAVLVIFGASGDLTSRKLFPALGRLAQHKRLSEEFAVVGVARTPLSDDEFRQRFLDSSGASGAGFVDGVRYVAGGYDDPDTYTRLREVLDELDRTIGTAGNR